VNRANASVIKRLERTAGRIAIAVLSIVGSSMHSWADDTFNPAYATIEQLRAALDSGQLSSEQLVRYYWDRIDRYDKKGPHINALIRLNPTALDRARQLDAARASTPHKGMLYGIPFIAKDNYNTAGLATSGGSAALLHSVPAANAFVLQRLLDQGAILIGKSNMSELAASYGRLGYSSAGGLTVNPYNTARDVSGSSSGSAAAVAADFAAFALGTDTGGSIRAPASVAGLVGLRPTLGLTSRSGVIPLSLTFDTTGALTRTVRDQAIVLDAIAGADNQDAATLQQPKHHGSYIDALDGSSLKGARLGVITNFRGANAEVDAVEQRALKELESQGAVLVRLSLPKEMENLWPLALGPVGEAEFKPQFERYLQALPKGQPKTLSELIQMSTSPVIADSTRPINPARLKALREADGTRLTDSPTYIHILTEVIPSVRRQLQTLMETNAVQALVFSTMSCPATPRFDRTDPSYVCRSDDPYEAGYVAAAAGFPEVTVPAGRISANMPVGFSFMGLPYAEAQLLRLTSAFQVAVPPPRAPLDSPAR
jgi:amidase